MSWTVDFYKDASGDAPVERFLDGLTAKQRAKLVGLIEILKEYGIALPFPYSSQVKGQLRELNAARKNSAAHSVLRGCKPRVPTTTWSG